MTSPFVAIIGGGISGLAAAYELQQRGVPFMLIEQSGTCGGVVRTEHVGGYTIDGGPDALLIQKPAAIEVCRELGLADRLRPQLHRATFVVRNGRLRELPAASVLGIPTRWLPFITTRAFSWRGKLRMGAELFVRRAAAGEDESIASFIGRRFGREAVDYLAEPLLAGIHGGHPAQLSMHAAFPRLLELERQYGSVISGLRAMALRKPAAAGVASPFVSLPDGMRELTEALLQRLPPSSIRTNAGVEAIDDRAGRFVVTLRDGSRMVAPRLLLATPPAVTSRLLRSVDADLSALCGRIRSASVVTVALGYPRDAVAHPLNGAGIVVPRREGLSLRALSWVSSKWEGRAPAGHVLMRAYVGGIQDPEAIARSDEDILTAVRRDLATLVGVSGEPEMTRLYRWRDATPQLEVGHAGLMAQIERRLADRPGLGVAASGFRGTGIADCVSDARRQAARLADQAAAALSV